jgi:hypothetical protein
VRRPDAASVFQPEETLVQNKNYFHFDPVGIDFIVFYGDPHFHDAHTGDAPEGFDGSIESYLNSIFKTGGRFSNDMGYPGYIGVAHDRYLLWRRWSIAGALELKR